MSPGRLTSLDWGKTSPRTHTVRQGATHRQVAFLATDRTGSTGVEKMGATIIRLPVRLLVEPSRVPAYHVIDPEVSIGVVALDVIEPAIVDLFIGHWEQRRILLHNLLRLADQRFAPCRVELAVDLRQQFLKGSVVPFGVILRPIFAVP